MFPKIIGLQNKISVIVIICLTFIIFGAYLIPQWYAFFVSNPYFYTNAWDDANYFCYQGAVGGENLPGYFILYVVHWLQHEGLAGSLQNLLFCTFIPPAITYVLYRTFLLLKISPRRSLSYALIILFSSVLVGYENGFLVTHLKPPPDLGLFVTSWETYPVIIRAPNPQFSYLILTCALYLFVKYKKSFFLILPIPFLYYFVLVPYVVVLIIYFCASYLSKLTKIRVLLLNFFSYLIIGFLIYIGFNYFFHENEIIKQASNLYVLERKIYIPVVGVFGLLTYVLLKLTKIFNNQINHEYFFLTLISNCFFITNLQLITGFSLDIRHFIGYGNGIILGIFLVLTLEIINRGITEYNFKKYGLLQLKALSCASIFLQYSSLILIAKYTLLGQGFSFSSYNFKVNLGARFTKEQLNEIKSDPLHSIIVGSDASQRLPYGVVEVLAPVFSYQYNYPFVLKGCQYNIPLALNALDYIQHHYTKEDPIRRDIAERAILFFNSAALYTKLSYADQKYCQMQKYVVTTNFNVIIPEQQNFMVTFPNWSHLSSEISLDILHFVNISEIIINKMRRGGML